MEKAKYEIDESLLKDYDQKYKDGITFLRRNDGTISQSKRVNVYVDGILTTLPEEMLNRLIDIGFYVVVGRKQ